MTEPEREETGEAGPGRPWGGPFTWTGLLALGWLLYELTAQPALGAIAVCVKFGWEDFRTALWLRRRDPDGRRGRACFWLYAGSGLWKTALVSLVMAFAMVAVAVGVEAHRGPPAAQRRRQIEEVLASTGLTMLAAFGLSALATLRAVWCARRDRLRLWLHSAVHRACWADVWPPQDYSAGRRNRLGCLLATAVTLTLVAAAVLACVLVPALALLVGVFALGWFVVPVAVLLFRDYALRHLWAHAPEECWGVVGPDPVGEGYRG